TLLADVTWQISEGERWVVLGPNGAGKSTLLNLAAARLHPTSGTLSLLGRPLGRTDVFDLRPRIGLAGATIAVRIPAAERVQDVVLTAAYAVTGRWTEQYGRVDTRRAETLLASVGIAGLADRTFGTLSEGERQRVLIARALMADPELLLLDEPAAGLDLVARADLGQRLAQLAADPSAPAMVLVTHQVEEIPEHFTDILLLRQGQVIAAGPISQALTEETLSATFGAPVRLDRTDSGWTAALAAAGGGETISRVAG
ncbi:MAG: ABC transporter ATP-binding protein, partial [Angustibacter sp.]